MSNYERYNKYQPNKDEYYKYTNGALVKYISLDTMNNWIFQEIGSGKRYYTKNPNDFETLLDIHDLKFLVDLSLDTYDKEWFKNVTDRININE